jgi:hypothetical protein
MKYLGLNRWRFIAHLKAVALRVEGVASALGLLPNLRRPGDRARRLYLGVALYGSPIWAGVAGSDRRCRALLAWAIRRLILRIARAYCTTSFAAAGVLASSLPYTYWRRCTPSCSSSGVVSAMGRDPLGNIVGTFEVCKRQAR